MFKVIILYVIINNFILSYIKLNYLKYNTIILDKITYNKKMLNRGIQQPNYCQGKRLPNKNMEVELVFCLPTIML